MENLICEHCGSRYLDEDIKDDSVRCANCGTHRYVDRDEDITDFRPPDKLEKDKKVEQKTYNPQIFIITALCWPIQGNYRNPLPLKILLPLIFILSYIGSEAGKLLASTMKNKIATAWPKSTKFPPVIALLQALLAASWWYVWGGMIYTLFIRHLFPNSHIFGPYEVEYFLLIILGGTFLLNCDARYEYLRKINDSSHRPRNSQDTNNF